MADGHTVQAVVGTQHVKVEIDGEVVADSHHPVLLYETGIPVRYYLPPEDVAMSRLEPTATSTVCPFKGDASYWSYHDSEGRVRDDVAWAYLEPLPTVAQIKGHLSFYGRKAAITVDGEPA